MLGSGTEQSVLLLGCESSSRLLPASSMPTIQYCIASNGQATRATKKDKFKIRFNTVPCHYSSKSLRHHTSASKSYGQVASICWDLKYISTYHFGLLDPMWISLMSNENTESVFFGNWYQGIEVSGRYRPARNMQSGENSI